MAKTVIETHPFEAFIPKNIKCLIVGSFPGKEQTQCEVDETHWFYGAPRNQLWKILEIVYKQELKNRKQKQQLFEEAGIRGVVAELSLIVIFPSLALLS